MQQPVVDQPSDAGQAREGDPADVLTVEGLTVTFPSAGRGITPVNGVTLAIQRGEILGVVGESGCGKSTLGRAIVGLVPASGGSARLNDSEVTTLSGRGLRRLRRYVQMVFQDPKGSLNPRMKVGEVIAEPLRVHRLAGRRQRRRLAREMLERVGLRAEHADRRPGELSGGQQQRIGIARALVTHPELVILDEPVSALDVSVQAQVTNLLQDLQEEFGGAYLFITHDLAVVRHISTRVAVMYMGEIVEQAPADELFARPRHPYTMGLVASVLPPDMHAAERLESAQQLASGDVPSLAEPPTGCRYHTRCPFARQRCRDERPVLEPTGPDGGAVACHFWREIAGAEAAHQAGPNEMRGDPA